MCLIFLHFHSESWATDQSINRQKKRNPPRAEKHHEDSKENVKEEKNTFFAYIITYT